MRNASRDNRIRRALLVPVALVPLIGLLPSVASAEPAEPKPSPATTTTTTPPPTTARPTTAPTTKPAPTQTQEPTTRPNTPTTQPKPTITLPTTKPTTSTPQGPPGRLTVGAVRIVDPTGAGVPGATAYVRGCSGGPGATLGDGGATTVTGPCVQAKIDRVPTNWRVTGPSAMTRVSDSGRVEFRFTMERGGIVPPPTTTPPPPHGAVRIDLAARDQDGRGVASEYAVSECETGRPLGGARTDSNGNGGGAFPGRCITVVPTAWPASCVLLGPHAYARVVGNGVNHLRFRFRCGVTIPPGEVETEGALVKTDRLTGAPLGGARFAIARCESGDVVRSVTTGADGIAAFALPSGCYRAIETVAPAGYIRDGSGTAFQVHLTPRFEVRVTNVKIDAGPVVRNPEVRVPISSIPSGPTLRAS
ncbi:prealbumin-like fold domain-containing protein [Tsukamurella sp. 1534]|uniref:prealbumin-like fold domain-containing protein n=1 Tax=Tsukamurella sp. 1534 TaxID=1151061 RepID=UPI0002E8E255|nr:prealbumin-like fold domain-containing protein [Tsukamurella sp. 1534]